MADPLEQLKAALADRYAIERELGAGDSLRFQAEVTAKRIAAAK